MKSRSRKYHSRRHRTRRLKRGGAPPEEEEFVIDSDDGSQALGSPVMYPPLREGDAGEVSEEEEVVSGELVEEGEGGTPGPGGLSSLEVSEEQASPGRPASSRVLSAQREPVPRREPTSQREPTPPKSATQVEEELVFEEETETPELRRSSMGVVPPSARVPPPPARVPPSPRVPTPPARVPTPPARVPPPPARVPTPPITADNRQAIIDIARIYVKPVEGARTPTSLESKLYEFGLNLFEHNKNKALTISEFRCLRPEQIIYKNTKTKRPNKLYTDNNRTVKKHLEKEHGLILKTKTELKDVLNPIQAAECRLPAQDEPVAPQIVIEPPPQRMMDVAPPVALEGVNVSQIKSQILEGVRDVLDRVISNQTMRMGGGRKSKRHTRRHKKQKQRVQRKMVSRKGRGRRMVKKQRRTRRR